MPDKTAIVMPWQRDAEPISVTKKIRTPECTKPLVSLETRGFVYIEFGGEGEIRTLDTVSCIHTFQACSLSHSDTSPYLFKHVLSVEAR